MCEVDANALAEILWYTGYHLAPKWWLVLRKWLILTHLKSSLFIIKMHAVRLTIPSDLVLKSWVMSRNWERYFSLRFSSDRADDDFLNRLNWSLPIDDTWVSTDYLKFDKYDPRSTSRLSSAFFIKKTTGESVLKES